jgi:hypothetical protein
MATHQLFLEDYEIQAVLEVITSPEASALVRSGEGKIAIGNATVKLQQSQPFIEATPEDEKTDVEPTEDVPGPP